MKKALDNMKYPKNLVFLDFDGVCTCTDDSTYFNSDPKHYHSSEAIMSRLLKFCAKHDAKVVITSNWRKFDADGSWTNGYGTYANPLSELVEKLGDFYFDILPPIRHTTKSEATILWLEDNSSFKGGFVIFDDDLREKFQVTSDYRLKDHFLLVDPKHGLTDTILAKAHKLMH